MEKKWRVYAPEGRDTSYDVKMNLRTMSNSAHLMGRGERFVTPVVKDDYGDDIYRMDINGEEVAVIAREKGQRTHKEGIFDNLDKGIFFNASNENARDAESKLVKAFF